MSRQWKGLVWKVGIRGGLWKYQYYPCPRFPGGSGVKNLLVHEAQEVLATSLGQEDSPGGGTGNPLQYPCLGNALDGGAWWAPVRGVRQDRGLSRRAPLPCSEPEQQEGLRREARPGPPSGGDPGEVRWAQGWTVLPERALWTRVRAGTGGCV